MRSLHRGSWEQTAHLFGFDDALDANGHGRGAMRNLVFLRSSDYLRKRVLENAEELVGHFRFGPKETLQALDPFEIGNDYTAGVAKNVWNDKYLILALFQN